MNTITFLGLTGGFLVTISFLPQVIKTLKLKEARDLSLGTFVMLWLAGVLWSTYGLIIKDLPLIIFNVIPVVLNSIIISLKLKYK